ncbi:hypothetical protein GC176_21275 [bacterium]|nr:hypothetical protein [bacterium]
MAKQINDLVLYLPFSEFQAGSTPDHSGAHRHGTIVGKPRLSHDAIVGASIVFAAPDQGVESPQQGTPSLTGDQTIAMWIRPSEFGDRRVVFNKTPAGEGAIMLDAGGMLAYRYSGDQAAGEGTGEVGAREPIETDVWTHISVVRDLSARTISWYLNGRLSNREEATQDTVAAADGPIVVAGGGDAAGMIGGIAHLRVYSRALAADEIVRTMDSDQTALSAFHQAHPIGFRIYDDHEHDVLAIRESPATYYLEILNETSKPVRFVPADAAATDTKGSGALFDLCFRPGTLEDAALDKLCITEQGWRVSYSKSADGCVTLHFHSDQEVSIKPGAFQRLTITNVVVVPGGGSRGTRVLFRYRGLATAGGQALTRTRLRHVSIVNERGRVSIPLRLDIVGSRRIQNNGVTANTLRLRVTNTLPDDPAERENNTIRFNSAQQDAPSKAILAFDTQPNGRSVPWAIASNDHAIGFGVFHNGRQVPAESVEGRSPEWSLHPAVTKLGPAEFFDIELRNVYTDLQPGPTAVYLHYENIPGYRDGTLTTTVEKSPVCFSGSSVGVGVAVPSSTFDVTNQNSAFFRVYNFSRGEGSIAGTRLVGEWHGAGAGAQVRYTGAGSGFIDIGQDRHGGFVVESDDIPRLVVQKDGAVVVGSSRAFGFFDVTNPNSSFFRVYNFPKGEGSIAGTRLVGEWHGGGAGAQVRYTGAGSGFIDIGQDANGGFVVETDDAPRLTVQKNGYVGIGTTTPKTRFHVQGHYMVLSKAANNEEAKKLLQDNAMPAHSLIIGGPWLDQIYFYWKDNTGKHYTATIKGSNF